MAAGPGGTPTIGFVIGVREVDGKLYDRLLQPGETAATAESYLVRKSGDQVEYLSSLGDGIGPMKKRLALDTADLAASYVMDKPGGFATRVDYAGEPVLVTGRGIAELPRFLVRTIVLSEALAVTDTRLNTLLTVFILVIVGVTVAILAVWRHGTSVKAARSAERQRIANENLENFSKFLRVVTAGQPTAVSAVARKGIYIFANARAAAEAEGTPITHEEMVASTMASVIGPIRSRVYQEINEQVLNSRQPANQTHCFPVEDGATRTVVSDHIYLSADGKFPEGVLMIVQDVTDVVRERERRERTMRALVTMLVDCCDPFSADQSQSVAEVSAEIAEEMGEPEGTQRTVDVAGNLMNLGKTLVPPGS